MISLQRSLGRNSLALLAVLIVCLLPAAAGAVETIKLTNTSGGAVKVEPSSSDGRTVYPGKPFVLNPGAKSAGIRLPGDKVIILRDASGRVVGKLSIPSSNDDQDYDLSWEKGPDGKSTWMIKPSK